MIQYLQLHKRLRLKSGLVIFLIIFGVNWSIAQTDIYLDECRKMARADYSDEKQMRLVDELATEQQSLLKKMIRPEVSAYGFAAYLTDVPDPASALAYAFDFNPVPHERLNAGIYFSQRIYKGGEYQLKKEEIQLNTELEQQKTEEKMMFIDNIVDEIFLGIILVQNGINVLGIQQEILDIQLKNTKAFVQEGKLLQKDLLQVEMSVIDAETRIEEMKSEDIKYRNMLSELTGQEIKPEDRLVVPNTAEINEKIADPAFSQIDIQTQKTELARKLSRSAALPKAQLLGIAGYGKPGVNYFVNQADWYSGVGLLFNVPITAWYDHARRDKILLIESDRLSEYRHALQKKRLLLETKYSGEVFRCETLEKQQTLIIEKKEQYRKQMEILLNEGEVSLSDYLTALNEETGAKLKKEAIVIEKMKETMKRNRIVVNHSNYPEK